MNKDPFKIAFGGARCTAQLIRSSGNGAVYRIENEHGDTKVLKLYNAAKFVGHMQQTLTREHRAAIRLLFDWASTVEFREGGVVEIRYFDIHRIADDNMHQFSCKQVLQRAGFMVRCHRTRLETNPCPQHSIAHTVPFQAYRGAIVMPMLGDDLYEIGKLPPSLVNKLLITLYEAAESATAKNMCHNDIKPDNVCIAGDAQAPCFVIIDADAIPPAFTGGLYGTYVLPEFGCDGSRQMLGQIAITIAFANGDINRTDLHRFHYKCDPKPTKQDLLDISIEPLHAYINAIYANDVTRALQLLESAASTLPYK